MTEHSPHLIVRFAPSHVPESLGIHRHAFSGYAHVALGGRYLERMLRWYASSPQSIAYVALNPEGRVVGYVFGTDRAGSAAAAAHLRGESIVAMIKRPWLIARKDVRSAALRRVRSGKGAWSRDFSVSTVSLVGIAVSDQERRRGVGSALVLAFTMEARSRGADTITLSVYEDNRSGRELYERNGWLRAAGDDGSGVLTYYQRLKA